MGLKHRGNIRKFAPLTEFEKHFIQNFINTFFKVFWQLNFVKIS